MLGESKFYGHVTAKDSQHVTMKDYTWMTTSLYRKYNTFNDRESEQQHKTVTFAVSYSDLIAVETVNWLISQRHSFNKKDKYFIYVIKKQVNL